MDVPWKEKAGVLDSAPITKPFRNELFNSAQIGRHNRPNKVILNIFASTIISNLPNSVNMRRSKLK